MIIENGHIRVKVKVETQRNANGYYTKPSQEKWSNPIPCQWSQTSANNSEVVNGEHYKTASYTILIDADTTVCVGEQLQLISTSGTSLGEYSVISIEHLFAVGELRLTI